MTQVFLLGTFHFSGDSTDFFAEDTQQQLRTLNEQLAKFEPDAICVEVQTKYHSILNTAYESIPLEIFSDYEKMRNGRFGKRSILHKFGVLRNNFLVGGYYSYKNEIAQIGIRLGKTLGLRKIHAIDEFIYHLSNIRGIKKPQDIQAAYDRHAMHITDMAAGSLYDRILAINAEKWSYHNHQLYIGPNEAGAATDYRGANYAGRWYTRNLRIFANIQKLCKTHKRVFVVYGAGHLYTLREFINACEYMELVDYRDYLENCHD